MALALNVFQTVVGVASTSPTEIYTAPVGYTGVVLLAQATNIGSVSYDISLSHRRDVTTTEMLKSFPISANDSANLLTGKLVLESADKLVLSASDGTNIKYVLSILETLN